MVCVPYSVCICSVVPSVPAHNYSISGQSGVSDVSSDVCSVSSTWCIRGVARNLALLRQD